MTVEEIIEAVYSGKYTSIWDARDDLNLLYVDDLPDYAEEHRWYRISGMVFKADDGFVAIVGVSKLYSESMTFSDCDVLCMAFEVEQIEKTIRTYREV